MRTNQATKRLDTVLRAAMGESAARAKLFTNKKDGIISAGWAPFVLVQCRSDADTHLEWDKTKAQELGLDIATIEKDFGAAWAAALPGGNVEWERASV